MDAAASAPSSSLEDIQWVWKSNPDSWSESQPEAWSHYSDLQNLIIEEAFVKKEPKATLDGCHIDFERNVQVFDDDESKTTPVRRLVRKREDKHSRETRFMDVPLPSFALRCYTCFIFSD
jgi:hypothetical protein